MKELNRKDSYTSASALPIKIFRNNTLMESLNRGEIPPFHLQISLTNKCNLKCSFCSCKARDKSLELSTFQIRDIARQAASLGCKAVTVTGGGEPVMHPNFSEAIGSFHWNRIRVGLVTNGLLFRKHHFETLKKITWCRISCADDREFTSAAIANLAEVVSLPMREGVDWAFSYVVGERHDPENLAKYIDFANKYNFTHVRVVSDLCNLDNVKGMNEIRQKQKNLGVDDSRVIYQGRKDYVHGSNRCWIALLKPFIGSDGMIYPCCGVQYAHEVQDYDLPANMIIGRAKDLKEIIKKREPFDGSLCKRCYYQDYNDILDRMMAPIEHREFV